MLKGIALHPLIRVISFLILGGFLALGGFNDLLIAIGAITLAYALAGAGLAGAAWPMLRRMRWLFLSLLIIYFWFTPGQPLLFPQGPTQEGIETGLQQIGSLVMLVMAVSLLLQTTTRAQLIVAILWLAAPLGWIGFSTERLAVRLVLTLETVVDAQQLLKQRMPAATDSNPIARIGNVASELFEGVIARAEQAACHAIEIPDFGHPPLHQWLYPFALGVIFWLAG